MNKTRIDWCDYTVNPVKGLCPVDCKDLEGNSYCYARAMYRRFKWDETIRLDGWVFRRDIPRDKASRIFVGSTIELFGPWVKPTWLDGILGVVKAHPQHTFIFLTKRPWELQKHNPWPTNCWVGLSIDKRSMESRIMDMYHVNAPVRFLSIEPMLEPIYVGLSFGYIDWVILGGKTGRKKSYPPEDWIRRIGGAAEAAGIPIFEKSNLRPMGPYRQEFPQTNAKGVSKA